MYPHFQKTTTFQPTNFPTEAVPLIKSLEIEFILGISVSIGNNSSIETND
jgi:hypothetical protein